MRQRNRAHKKAKQKNTPDYWKKYGDIRNEVVSLVPEAKNEQLSKLQNTLVDKTIPPGKLVNGGELLNHFVISKIELLPLAQLM